MHYCADGYSRRIVTDNELCRFSTTCEEYRNEIGNNNNTCSRVTLESVSSYSVSPLLFGVTR